MTNSFLVWANFMVSLGCVYRKLTQKSTISKSQELSTLSLAFIWHGCLQYLQFSEWFYNWNIICSLENTTFTKWSVIHAKTVIFEYIIILLKKPLPLIFAKSSECYTKNSWNFVKMAFLSEHMMKSYGIFRDDHNRRPKFESVSLIWPKSIPKWQF